MLLLFSIATVNAQEIPADVQLREYIAVVRSDVAPIYANPDANSVRVYALTSGTRVPVISRSGDWYQLALRVGLNGWVAADGVAIERYVPPTTLLPQDTALYLSLDTSPLMFDRLGEMTAFRTTVDPDSLPALFDNLLTTLFAEAEIDLDQVRLFLGDEVVITNLQCVATTEALNPDVAVIASVLDTNGAAAFLNQVYTSGRIAETATEPIVYEGYSFTLITDPEDDSLQYAIGIVDSFMVLTRSQAAYQQVVDAANGSSTLDVNPEFQASFGALERDAFVRMYVRPNQLCNDAAVQSVSEADTTAYGVSFKMSDSTDGLVVNILNGEEVSTSEDDLFSPQTFKTLTFGIFDNPNLYIELDAVTPNTDFEAQTGIPLQNIEGTVSVGYINNPEGTGYLVALIDNADEDAVSALTEAFTANGAVIAQEGEVTVATLQEPSRTFEIAMLGEQIVVVSGGNLERVLAAAVEDRISWETLVGLVEGDEAADPFAVALEMSSQNTAGELRSYFEVAAVVLPSPTDQGSLPQIILYGHLCGSARCFAAP